MAPKAFALASALLAGAAAAQPAPEAPRATAAVEVRILNLDVVVTDRRGAPVHGLSADDFEVRLAGRAVPLTHFAEERRAAAPGLVEAPPAAAPPATPTPSAAPTPAAPRRRVVVFLDRLALHEGWKRSELFGGLKSLFRKSLGPSDQGMLVAFERSVRYVQPFTSDLGALDRALDAAARRTARVGGEGLTGDQLGELQDWFALVRGAAGQGASDEDALVAQNLEATQAFSEFKAKEAALRSVIAALAGVEGRKVLVFVSHRFSRYPGLEFYLKKRARPEEAIDAGRRSFDAESLLEDLAAESNAAGVTLYPLFPFAMDTTLLSAADPKSSYPRMAQIRGRTMTQESAPLGGRELMVQNNEMQALETLAERTGGKASLAEISLFADQVASDLDSWYSVGVRFDRGMSGSVTVKVKKPGLAARARRSFADKSPEERVKDRVLANFYAPDAEAKLPLQVIVKPPAGEKGSVHVPLSLGVPIGKLALVPDGNGLKGSFSVFVASAGPAGEFSAVTRKRCTLSIPEKDAARAKAGLYRYDLEVVVASAESRVSVGVWDELGGEAGFALAQGGRLR